MLVLWAAASMPRAAVATSAARAAASRACGVLRSPLVRRRARAVRGSGRTSRALSQPLLPACEPPGRPGPRKAAASSRRRGTGTVSRHAWTCPGGFRAGFASIPPILLVGSYDAVATHSGSVLEGQAQERIGIESVVERGGGKRGPTAQSS